MPTAGFSFLEFRWLEGRDVTGRIYMCVPLLNKKIGRNGNSLHTATVIIVEVGRAEDTQRRNILGRP